MWQYRYSTKRYIRVKLNLLTFKNNFLMKSTFTTTQLKRCPFTFLLWNFPSSMDVVVNLTSFYEESQFHSYPRSNFAIKIEQNGPYFPVLIFSYLVLNKDQLKMFGPSQFFTTTKFYSWKIETKNRDKIRLKKISPYLGQIRTGRSNPT